MNRKASLALRVVFAIALFTAMVCQAQLPFPVLQKHVRDVVASGQAHTIAHLPATYSMHIAILLPLRNQNELDSLLKRLYDPASPDYHKFLTADQFTEQFGPTVADYQSVVDFAQVNGFTVGKSATNRLLVEATGSVAQIENAFHITMNLYQHPTENRAFFAPDREPAVNLSTPLWHISGLDNYSPPQPALSNNPSATAALTSTGSGPGGSFLPLDMRAAYASGTTLDGSGQCVGLGEFGGYAIGDVVESFNGAASETANGNNYILTYTTGGKQTNIQINNVLLAGATAGSSNGFDIEQVLDIAQAIGMAPGLSQVRVYTVPYEFKIVDANGHVYAIVENSADSILFNSMLSENLCKQLSLSWHWTPSTLAANDTIFEGFAAQGQSFFAASGDWGGFPTLEQFYYPAEDAYVTSVGGTDLTTTGPAGSWVSETAWTFSSGGISPDNEPIPSYQQLPGVINASNGGSTVYRNIPDVAMEGNSDNFVCGNGGGCFNNIGGTSFAAPRWAGYMALVNQKATQTGQPLIGFINPAIYATGTSPSYQINFHDITSGNNDCHPLDSTDCGSVFYNAVPGFDLVTGWGSPNGTNLINGLLIPAPTGLTGIAGVQMALFAWNAVPQATSYNYYKSYTPGAETLAYTGITQTNWRNITQTPGKTIYYQVTAVNAAGESARSNEIAVTPLPLPAPAAVAKAGNGTVTLSWAPVTSIGETVTYSIFRGTTSGGESSTAIVSGFTGLYYTDTNVTNGTTYYYTVQAVDSISKSVQSAELVATPSSAIPLPPTNLVGVAGVQAAFFAWTASAGATSYNYYKSYTSGDESSTPYTGITQTNWRNISQIPGKVIYYQVTAVNASGESARSNEIAVTPLPLPAPNPVTATAGIVPNGTAEVTLNWATVTSIGLQTTYSVFRGTTSGGESAVPIASGLTSTSYPDTNAIHGTTYYYTVQAVNSVSSSAQSNEVSAKP